MGLCEVDARSGRCEAIEFCLTQRLQHVATSKTAHTRAGRRHTTTKAWRDGHIKDDTRHSPDLKNSHFVTTLAVTTMSAPACAHMCKRKQKRHTKLARLP